VALPAMVVGGAAIIIIDQGWPNYGPPNTVHTFLSTTFATVDSATALTVACLLLTCLLRQHLAASSAIKVGTKRCGFIIVLCYTVHFNNLFFA